MAAISTLHEQKASLGASFKGSQLSQTNATAECLKL